MAITIIISSAYVLLLIYVMNAWDKLSPKKDSDQSHLNSDDFSISIIIAARNEESFIGICLDALIQQATEYESCIDHIIVVDDHSTDNTAQVVLARKNKLVRLLDLSDKLEPNKSYNAYKKLALSYAMSETRSPYILQLDADVIISEGYLGCIIKAIQQHDPDLMTCPVVFESDGSPFQDFQCLDMMGMMMLTGAGIQTQKWYMANGANMAYRRDLVSHADNETASGDDISAIQKMATRKDAKIMFLKDKRAVVRTPAEDTLSQFFAQRIRWATKNKSMKGGPMQLMMTIPFVTVLWLFVHPIMYIYLGNMALVMALFHVFCKVSMDYIYLREAATFFGENKRMEHFWYSSIAHILYIAIIGTGSLFVRKYKWKGRRVS